MKSVFSLLLNSAQNHGSKIALICKEEKLTYNEVYQAATRVAASLLKYGNKNEVVGLYMENSIDWLVTYFGILAAGMTAMPISLRVSEENLKNQINLLQPVTIITNEKLFPKLERIFHNQDINQKIVLASDIKNNDTLKEIKKSDLVAMLFTSGTTSAQKAVELPHQVVLSANRNIQEYLQFKENDIYYAILPFYHSFGLGNVYSMFLVGGTVIISNAGTNLKQVAEDITKYKATFFAATPLTLSQLTNYFLDYFAKAGETLKKICTNTGPMPPEITTKILDNLPNTNFYTYYGLTEASRSTFFHFNNHRDKLTSVGQASPNVMVEVVDENNNKIEAKKIGEIRIKGDHVVPGYYKNPDKTKEKFKDGWMYTGDMGFFDEEDFLFISGRVDDMADIGGERFSLHEVDNTIRLLNAVEDVASFIAKSNFQPIIVSCVVLNDEKELTAEEIISYCRPKLDSYKIPNKILFVKEIPKTDNGKIKRNFLKEKYGLD